jgi:hypothetical protein
MSTRPSENPDQMAPRAVDPADLGLSMTRETNGLRQPAADLKNPQIAEDALLHWDELDEQLLRMLADDPEHGRRLGTLRNADAWLRSRAADAARQAPGPISLIDCPPAEDLYVFGEGPGAEGMSDMRRAEIDRHLATCIQCERFVSTLAIAPPSPLIYGMPESDSAASEAAETATADAGPQAIPVLSPRRLRPVARPRRLWIGIAAAAALVIAVGIWEASTPSGHGARWPEAPVLRGSDAGALLFPRVRVLARTPELVAAFPALGSPLVFEIEPQAEATGYRVDLTQNDGSAFGPSTALPSLTAAVPNLTSATVNFAAGHYTWKAWSAVRGLDQPLGSRGFEVCADPDTSRALQALSLRAEPSRTIAAIALLHERGYVGDARALARALPAGPERDRYLGQTPGR